MKKIFVSLFAVLISLSTMAILPTKGFITLKRMNHPGSVTPIGGIPYSLDVPSFSAFQTPDEIIITSEAVSTTVTVNIYNAAGAVVATVTETVSAGSEFSIDVTNLPTGAYILEIAFDDTIYVGQFEL